MIFKRISNRLFHEYYFNISQNKGWKTHEKIIVFESDDWGTIRMPDYDTFNRLKAEGINVENCNYSKYDNLETNEDLSLLFEVLMGHKDLKGNHPIFTANTILANPDFEKISSSKFHYYYYEKFTTTYKKYYNQNLNLWYEGINNKVFFPQFHGREHLNVIRWMDLLRNNSHEVKLTFNNKMWGLKTQISNEKNLSLMAAFDFDNKIELKKHSEIIKDGLNLFEEIFGYRSSSFIAPNYTWHTSLEKALLDCGIKYIQGNLFQFFPIKNGKNKKIYHYTGETNKLNQIYLKRNCLFEPSRLINRDWVDSCLADIQRSFKYKQPAIICSHRVNFMGNIIKSNRDKGLNNLNELIKSIIKKWPDVIFLTTEQLGVKIENDR